MILASIVPVEAPPHRPDASGELDALIEEARRRARRRRLGYLALVAAAALTAGGLYLAFGGGGDNTAPGGGPASTEPAATASGTDSSGTSPQSRCPTSLAALRKVRPGSGIAGCVIRFSATLPPGWYQPRPRRVSVVPPGALLTSGPAQVVRYANFPVSYRGPLWPVPAPPGGILIGIFPQAPVTDAQAANAPPPAVKRAAFRPSPNTPGRVAATTSLYSGRWRFEVQVVAKRARAGLVDQANAVLNSIETRQHLCPCGPG